MAALARAPKVAFRKNPRRRTYVNPSTSDRLAEAAGFYEDFHWGEPANKVVRARIPRVPKVATELGELVSVTYRTSKGGELAMWQHEFGEEGGRRPRLVVDPRNKKLHIVGGTYDVQQAGIID